MLQTRAKCCLCQNFAGDEDDDDEMEDDEAEEFDDEFDDQCVHAIQHEKPIIR